MCRKRSNTNLQWRLVAEPDGFFTLSIRDLELGEDGDVVFAVDDRPPFHWSIEPADPNDPTVYMYGFSHRFQNFCDY